MPVFESIHRYYKPLNIEGQVNDARKNGEQLTFAATKELAITPGFIYVPVQGLVAILHAESELTIGNAIDYMPIGLMERYCPMLIFKYKCMTPVKVVEIPCERFDEIFLRMLRVCGLSQAF